MAGGQGGQGGGQGQVPRINPQMLQNLQGMLSQYQGSQGYPGSSQGQGGFQNLGQAQVGFLQGGQPPMQGGMQAPAAPSLAGPMGVAAQSPGISQDRMQDIYNAKMASGQIGMGQQGGQGVQGGQMNTMIGMVGPGGQILGPNDPGFVSPSAPQTFNTKPFNQGPAGQPTTIGATSQNQNFMQGVDATGNAPGTNMGFDDSGSDGGVAGRPAPMQGVFAPQSTGSGTNQAQNSWQGIANIGRLRGGNPPMLSDFRPQTGLQIQGNPTAQTVNSGPAMMQNYTGLQQR